MKTLSETLAYTVHFAFVVTFAQRSTLVEFALTLAERYFKLGPSVFIDEESQRNDGIPR